MQRGEDVPDRVLVLLLGAHSMSVPYFLRKHKRGQIAKIAAGFKKYYVIAAGLAELHSVRPDDAVAHTAPGLKVMLDLCAKSHIVGSWNEIPGDKSGWRFEKQMKPLMLNLSEPSGGEGWI